LLARLSGSQTVPYDDATFWSALLSSEQRPLAEEDPVAVQDALTPHCRQLLLHNSSTGNLQALLLHVLDATTAATAGHPTVGTANGLRLLALIVKHAAESCSPAAVVAAFEVTPGLPTAVQGVLYVCATGSAWLQCVAAAAAAATTKQYTASAAVLKLQRTYMHPVAAAGGILAGLRSLAPMLMSRVALLVCGLQPTCACATLLPSPCLPSASNTQQRMPPTSPGPLLPFALPSNTESLGAV
jgi:Dyggve-Melchior-Clausen syndrome protein